MVTEWGMNELIGPVNFSNEQNEVFLGRDFGHVKEYSEETAKLIDDEVRKILLTASEKVEKLLRDNIEILHRGAKVLLERETIDAEELDMIVAGKELPPISNLKIKALRSMKFNGNPIESDEQKKFEY